MPISGYAANFCCCGADPSKGGKAGALDIESNTICHGKRSTNLSPMENEFASSAPEINPDAVDLDAIEQDLADVETALARLEAGTYWTCETTGKELPSELLAAQPTARSVTSL